MTELRDTPDRLRIGKNRVLLENARREEILAPTAKSVRVRVRAGLVTFTGVPAASMAAFRKALGTIDWGRGK